VGLNHLRKNNTKLASTIAQQMMDNVMIAAGIPFNI
jgi:hypothetical protein